MHPTVLGFQFQHLLAPAGIPGIFDFCPDESHRSSGPNGVPCRFLLCGFIIKKNLIRGCILKNLYYFSPHAFKKFRITLIITEFRLITT